MSLDAVLRSAITGLNASQAALRVTSTNIANVNTPGYARQEVQFATTVVGNETAGVEISGIRRIVDAFLQGELVNATANASYHERQAELHDKLQTVLGRPDGGNTLAARLDKMFASLAETAVEPSDIARRIGAVSDIQTLADDIDRIARQVNTLRADADRQIASDINTINAALEEIFELNPLINEQMLIGGETSGLEERRQQAINRIADIVDIRVITQPDGFVNIATRSGLVLLDKTQRQLQYTPNGQVDTSSQFNQITVNKVDSITGVVASTGDPLYPGLRSGSLKGLLDMRDKELPEILSSLGELSSRVIDQLNAAHNDNSRVPAPNALTGRNVGALGTDPHGFTGDATFVVLDANNEIVSQYTVNLDNPALVTLNDVIADVNGNLTGGTLALTNGVMSLTATAGTNGVAIQQSAADPSSRGGRGFAHYFGMNDLMEARGPAHFDTGLTTAAGHGFGATGTVSISLQGPGAQVATTYTLNFASVGGTVNNVLSDLNTNFAGFATFGLDGNGKLTVTPAAGFGDYVINVSSDSTGRGTTGVTFSEFFGLGERHRQDAAFNVKLKDAIKADPNLLALAKVDLTAGAGVPALTTGDNRGALALQAAETAAVGFDAAGDLTSITTTLASYAGALLSTVGQEADKVSNLSQDRETLRAEIEAKREQISGVNLDEELANMIIYQQSYNAAARMITTANEMFDALLSVT